MTQDDLYAMLGHTDVQRDLDIKTLVLDLVRERLTPDEMMALFWEHLGDLDESEVRGYLYRHFSRQ